MIGHRILAKICRSAALIAVLFAVSGFLSSWSSSKPEVWEGWDAHNPKNTKPIDHSAWGAVLEKYISTDKTGLNRFAYGKVSQADKKTLKQYIAALSKIEITDRARSVQLAYWINLYNALTVDVVLDHYPVKSIRDIDISGLFADGPWGKALITIEGEEITLDDIEHQILRPIWKDPRIHYGVNCASIGCPNLLKTPFTGKTAQAQLERAASDFINSPRGLTIKNGKATVSKLYEWFAYDFGNSEKGVIKHLTRYA
ncbi:MAG: DUF547 domain-containing protein, partial [Rhizobiales bacterium]|nr:DUF547 domain-containing protein [Hyphomicrobiales bacterium]